MIFTGMYIPQDEDYEWVVQLDVFLRKNLWELLNAKVLHIFEISAVLFSGS
jgi:hypothetical protein